MSNSYAAYTLLKQGVNETAKLTRPGHTLCRSGLKA